MRFLREFDHGFREGTARSMEEVCQEKYSLEHSRMIGQAIREMSGWKLYPLALLIGAINRSYQLWCALGLETLRQKVFK